MFTEKNLDYYRWLISNHFPDVHGQTHELIRTGVDHDVVIVNSHWVFRFPKNEDALRRFQAEVRLLKYLDKDSTLNVPRYTHLVSDLSFGGYEKLEGKEFEPTIIEALTPEQRNNVAKQLGNFLSSLHATPISAAELSGFKHDPNTYWYSKRKATERYEEIKTTLFPRLDDRERVWICEVFETYISLPESDILVVCHGDFGPHNILLDTHSQRVGIIDFADTVIGYPEMDLAQLWRYGEDFLDTIVGFYSGTLNAQWKHMSRFAYQTKIVWAMRLLPAEKLDAFVSCRAELANMMDVR